MTRRQINSAMRAAGWEAKKLNGVWCYCLTIPGWYRQAYRDKPLAVAEQCGLDLAGAGPHRTQGGSAVVYTVIG